MTDSPANGNADQKPTSQADPASDSTLGKKYNGDWKKADAGYFELVNHSKKQQQQIDQLTAAVKQMADQSKPVQPDKWAKLADDYGLPVNDLSALIEEKAQAIAQRTVAEQFGPIANAMQARGAVVAKHKDFATAEAQVMEFINSDADRLAQFNDLSRQNAQAALELAYFEFMAQKPLGSRTTDSPEGAAARAAAGSPTGQPTGGGTSKSDEEPASLKAARERAIESRDVSHYLAEKYKDKPLTWSEIMLANTQKRE